MTEPQTPIERVAASGKPARLIHETTHKHDANVTVNLRGPLVVILTAVTCILLGFYLGTVQSAQAAAPVASGIPATVQSVKPLHGKTTHTDGMASVTLYVGQDDAQRVLAWAKNRQVKVQ